MTVHKTTATTQNTLAPAAQQQSQIATTRAPKPASTMSYQLGFTSGL